MVKMSRGEQLQRRITCPEKHAAKTEELNLKGNSYTYLLGRNVPHFSGWCVYLLLIVWIKPSALFGTSPTITQSRICGGKSLAELPPWHKSYLPPIIYCGNGM